VLVKEHERLSNITLKTQIKVKEHERLSNITLKTQIKVKEHERLSNITLKTQIKVKEHERLSNITLKTQIKVSLSCSFTSIFFLTNKALHFQMFEDGTTVYRKFTYIYKHRKQQMDRMCKFIVKNYGQFKTI
jgi:hypothetical protein